MINFIKNETKIIKKILFCLIVAWALTIFILSHMEAKDSTKVSGSTIEFVLEATNATDDLDERSSEILIENLQYFFRKSAHFLIYTVGGILFSLYYKVSKLSNLKIFAYSFLSGFLYALFDEIHQIFVPGRSGQLSDVLLDSSGVLTGIIGMFMIYFIVNNILKYNEKKEMLCIENI